MVRCGCRQGKEDDTGSNEKVCGAVSEELRRVSEGYAPISEKLYRYLDALAYQVSGNVV
jgi:hypothetical protein